MIYSADLTARLIIDHSIQIGYPVNNTKLNRLMYYLQAASLVENSRKFFEEPVYAWNSGPVVEEVYKKYRIYVSDPITDWQIIRENEYMEDHCIEMLEKVVNSYRDYDSISLIFKAKEEEPWQEVHDPENPYRAHEIPIEAMYLYYRRNLDEIYGKNTQEIRKSC